MVEQEGRIDNQKEQGSESLVIVKKRLYHLSVAGRITQVDGFFVTKIFLIAENGFKHEVDILTPLDKKHFIQKELLEHIKFLEELSKGRAKSKTISSESELYWSSQLNIVNGFLEAGTNKPLFLTEQSIKNWIATWMKMIEVYLPN